MRQDNLLAQRKTPFLKPPAERPSGVLVVPNLVRGLVPSAPDQIWVADITYVHLAKTFAYLAVILDAFSRKAVGWAFEDTLDASLAIAALEKAIAARKPAPGSLIHRSDRGVRTRPSPATGRSRHHHQHEQAGQPFDNAKAESFMKTLKAEQVNGKAFADLSDARRHINTFIEASDAHSVLLMPSATGQLQLLAGGDIAPATIAMFDADPGLLPGLFSSFQSVPDRVAFGVALAFPAILPSTPDAARTQQHK